MFDTDTQLGKDTRMSGLTKKIVAVFFALWLPLFSASALAASVQMPAGHCDDASMQMADMGDMDMHNMPGTPKSPASACDACGVCHLACTAYLAVPGMLCIPFRYFRSPASSSSRPRLTRDESVCRF